jgi:hypothetical protein
MTRRAPEGADDDLAQPQPRPLARGALALRVGHAAIAVAELGCLGYVWTCALTGRRDPLLRAAIGVLATEGVGLVIGRGDCPLGPLQQRMGDPVPLFELVLPPVWARRAVPILAGISGLGIALALRPVGRRPRVPRLAA